MSTVDSKADVVVVSVPTPLPQTTEQLLQGMSEALATMPTTVADAVALFKNLSNQLAQHLINNLPTLEDKAEALARIVIAEVKAVTCSKCF